MQPAASRGAGGAHGLRRGGLPLGARGRRGAALMLLRARASAAAAGRLCIALALCALPPGGAAAQGRTATDADGPPPPGAHLQVFLLTAEAGDAIWERFGHNALVVRDTLAGTDISYNWGMFSFRQESFLTRLVQGRMRYWMQGRDLSDELLGYRLQNRRVWMQPVLLTPSERQRLYDDLRRTDTPEHRFYRYDYYRDNCSTRVRDALDAVLGGALRARLDTIRTEHSYRWHTARLLQDVPWAFAGIQYVVGRAGDRPLSAWEESFLPTVLQRHLETLEVTHDDGSRGPLLGARREVVRAERPPEPETAPSGLLWGLAAGLLLAGGVVVARRRAERGGRFARAALGALAGGWGLIAGLAGTALVLSWVFTDHVFWRANENVLQLAPLALPLAVLGPAAAIGRARRAAARVAVGVAAASAGGFLLQVLPGFDQVNGFVIALALPVNLALAWSLLPPSEQPPLG
ncbi:MAG: DUF4105 domain-containing protein [Gemmatimonadetes bacterium]|nr:MAG: DUF4105 domain-containing protein [Gemmatimonadota bacterium]